MQKSLRALLALGLSCALVSACSSDDDDTASSSGSSGSRVAASTIEYTAPDVPAPLFPEGVVFDASDDSFLVSSAATGEISRVDQVGNRSSLVSSAVFGGNGTFGLALDAAGVRLYAVAANIRTPTVATLFAFDRASGEMLWSSDLAALTPGMNFGNDVAVDSVGNAWVTNSDQGVIYRVDPDGNAVIHFEDADLAPLDPASETGFNGIAWHRDGFLLVSHYVTGRIYRLSTGDNPLITEVALSGGALSGPDGLAVDGNTLVVVNNEGLSYVSRFRSTDGFASAQRDGDTWPAGDTFATTVTQAGADWFVNHALFNYPVYGQSPTDYRISKVSFNSAVRFNGTASELPRVNTPIEPLGYGTEYPAPYYAGCTSELATGAVDLRGDWVETEVVVDGQLRPVNEIPHAERIEQCGNRLLVASAGLLHEVFAADDSFYNGVNDVNVQGQPVHSTGRFEGEALILTPVFPLELEPALPDVTRRLIVDDSGATVLAFFNPLLGNTRYLRRSELVSE